MIIASLYQVLVYTDYKTSKTLLTEQDNDAHGRIAKSQERGGEYDLGVLLRPAKRHFMAIAEKCNDPMIGSYNN